MGRKHHVLVVGTGSIGERHLRCFLETGRVAASFVEINPAQRARIAEQYGAPGFADFEAALAARADAMAGPNLAVIATPAHLHVAFSTRLAAAGLHLLIEKPLGTTTDGVDRLAEVACQQRVTIGVAYVYRCFSALAAMRQALRSGQFGRPVELVAVCGQSFPTYRPAYRDTYYADRATGGGAIQDALTHLLNAGEWLVGPIDRLVADAAHQVLEGVAVEDTAHVLVRHGDVLGSYSLNQYQAPNEITLTIACDRGTVRWESHAHRWRWMTQPGDSWHDEPYEPRGRDEPFILQANQFLDAIEGASPPLCSLDEGLQSLRVNLAALASVDAGGWKSIGEAP